MIPTLARRWTCVPPCALALVLVAASPSLATIHAGDTVFVRVWNHPELSKQVAVDADGQVRVPLSGDVAIGGLDETAAAKKIQYALQPYVVYPAVSVETTEQTKSLFVSGGPVGVLTYKPGETLQAAVADELESAAAQPSTSSLNDAGQSVTSTNSGVAATRERLDLHAVKVVRDAQTLGPYDSVAFSQQGQSGPQLEPGDTIVFQYKPIQVRVVGDVAQPGLTYLSSTQSLSEALAQAGGTLPTAVSNHVLLLRDGRTQSLALGDPTFTQPAQSGDVITVPQAPRVDVVGIVMKPGVVSLKTDPTLISAIYDAGGPDKFADLRNIEIVHNGAKTSYNVTRLTHGDLSQNPVLADGDTVVVPRNNGIDLSPFFNILGAFAAGLAGRF